MTKLTKIANGLRQFAKDNRERGWKRIADDLDAAADLIECETAVPSGWQLVPVELTEEMLGVTSWPGCAGTDYRHMLAAAPKHVDAAMLTSSERVRMPEPMTDAELFALAERTLTRVQTDDWIGTNFNVAEFARVIEAEVLRRVREANK